MVCIREKTDVEDLLSEASTSWPPYPSYNWADSRSRGRPLQGKPGPPVPENHPRVILKGAKGGWRNIPNGAAQRNWWAGPSHAKRRNESKDKTLDTISARSTDQYLLDPTVCGCYDGTWKTDSTRRQEVISCLHWRMKKRQKMISVSWWQPPSQWKLTARLTGLFIGRRLVTPSSLYRPRNQTCMGGKNLPERCSCPVLLRMDSWMFVCAL